MASSSTSGGDTTGSTPAERRTISRDGELDARTMRRVGAGLAAGTVLMEDNGSGAAPDPKNGDAAASPVKGGDGVVAKQAGLAR